MNELLALLNRELDLDLIVEADTPLLSSGLVDSFTLTQLIEALEANYGRVIDLAAIGADNFDTGMQILRFVEGQQ